MFYTHINAWDYADAYKLFKPNSGQASYCSFADDYTLTEHDDMTYNGVKKLPDGTFKVAITIIATELFAKDTVKTRYNGYEIVDPVTWQIKGPGYLKKTVRILVAATPTPQDPVLAAQAVVQQFHSDINTHNYPDAYSLWGTDFHNTTDYCSFIQGYSQTQSENANIDMTTQLSNGTVQVLATINTTEDTASGTMTKVYHETDIVGQENGSWKIISGTKM